MKSRISTELPDTKAGSTPKEISVGLLAQILDISDRGVRWKAKAENWPFRELPVLGGRQKLFSVKHLPSDIKKRVKVHFGEIPDDLTEGIPIDFDPPKVARCATAWDCAREWQKDLARARKDVLDAWQAFRSTFSGTAKAADNRFVALFGERAVPGLEPEIYRRVKKLKRSALHDWQKRFAQQGIAGLISQHGHNRGQTRVPLEQQRYILGTFQNNPNLKPKKIAAVLNGKFDGESVSTRTVRMFLKRQARNNPQVFQFLQDPDGWKSKHQLALGSASEKAKHFLHYVEVDSTIADVMCSDGKRYNICGLIDIFSRKCKFLVTKTSSSWAIAGLLRNTILDWGLPENLVRDNGKDYGSQTITDACVQLGIEDRPLAPFTPEEKPHIERVFGTLTRDLFETLPGYCGHNVAERKAIENRKSFAERFGKGKQATGDPLFAKKSSAHGQHLTGDHEARDKRGDHTEEVLSARVGLLTPQELQTAIDRWTEQVYHLRVHSSLGASPNAKAASVPVRPRRIEDPRSLDILLAPAPKGETRVVLKDGIHLDGQKYWHDELIDWIGRKVRVKQDMRDAGRIFCFDPEFRMAGNESTGAATGPAVETDPSVGPRQTAFICEALDLAISGITRGDMIAAKKRAKKRMLDGVKAMRTLASEVGDPLAEEIRQIREGRATVTNLRVGDPVTDNPFVDAANAAARALEEKENEDENRGGRFCKNAIPGPLRKNSQIFSDETSFNQRIGLQDPKVIPFAPKAEDQEFRLYFKNFRERFEWLKEAQRHRALDGEEIRWLRTYINEWFDYADMFCESWPEDDRLWLGKIAPDHFPQYAAKEETR